MSGVICPVVERTPENGVVVGESLSLQAFAPEVVGVTAAWNTALAVCRSQNVGVLSIPKRYTFLSKPDPIDFDLDIVGVGQKRSALIRGYSPEDEDEGFIEIAYSYVNTKDIDISPGDSTSGGRGIRHILRSSPVRYGNWSWYRDMRIVPDESGAGTGSFKNAVYLEGDDSAVAPQAPGLRDIVFSNCWLRVPCSAAHLHAKTVRQFRFSGECDSNGVIFITGGNYQSQNVRLDMDFGGIVFADKVYNLSLSGAFTRGWAKSSVTNLSGVICCSNPWVNQASGGVFLGPPETGSSVNKSYNVFQDGIIVDTIVWDGVTPFDLPDGAYLKEVTV